MGGGGDGGKFGEGEGGTASRARVQWGLALVFILHISPSHIPQWEDLRPCIPHGTLKGLGAQQVLSESSLDSAIPRRL